MLNPTRHKMVRPLLWFTAALVLFLTIGVFLSQYRQRSLFIGHVTGEMDSAFSLLKTVIAKDVQNRDFKKIRRSLNLFSQHYPEISSIKIIDSRGSELAEYIRPQPAVRQLSRVYIIDQKDISVRVHLMHDLQELNDSLASLSWQNLTASIIFTILMTGFLWSVLRKTAFIPLENALQELATVNASLEQRVAERTMDLMRANTDLQNEIVEREAAERELLTKERAIATSINGIALTDFNLRITYVNNSCLAIWGYSHAGEVIGRSALEFWHSTEAVQMVMHNLESSGFWFGELAGKKKDGTLFDVQVAADLVKDGNGRPICIMASLLDISDRKQADAELRKERDFTQAILNTVGAIVIVLDREGRIIRFNRTCEQVSGYRFDEAHGKLFWDFLLSPEQVEPIRAVFEMLSEGKFPSSYENYWVTKTGEKRMISWSNTCLTDQAGNVSHVIVTGIDITEKRRAAEELEKSQAMQRMVVESINEIIYLVSLSREGLREKMSFVGGRVVDIVGYSADDFIRDPLFWFSIVHPEDLPGLTASTRNLVQFKTEVTRVYRVRHRVTNEYLWMEDKIMPQLLENSVVGYFGVARDITRRKIAEDKLRKALIRAEEEKNKSDAIIAAIGDGISIQDRDFKILYQNIHQRELIGDHVGEFCYSAYQGREDVCPDCGIAQSFADGKVHVREQPGLSDKGAMLVEITSSPIKDASGHIIAGLELVRNITDRKKAVERLHIAYETQFAINALLRVSLDNKPLKEVLQEALRIVLSSTWCLDEAKGTICLIDEDGGLKMTVQSGFEDVLPGGCTQMNSTRALCRLAAQTGLIKIASGRGTSGCESLSANDHYRVPIGEGGKCLGVLSICLKNQHLSDDEPREEFLSAVTGALTGLIERKRLEDEREQMISDLQSLLGTVSASRLEWQETFDSITDMISIQDEHSRIIKANKAFAERLGMNPRDVVHKKCSELFPEHSSLIECMGAEIVERAGPLTLETSDPKTGRMFLVSTFPFYSAESRTRGTVRVARDITEAKENEMRLIMSERLAALGQMASGVAHEINNPLAAIAGCVDGMSRRISRGEFDQELFKKYLTIMKEELTRSKNITTTMLSVVRKKDYEKKQMNLHEAMNKSLEIIGYQGRLKNVDVQKYFDERMPYILGSEGELKQVFLIILCNALDAMQDKGALVIRTAVKANTLSVEIADSGPGIPSDNFSRIFDPFFTTKSDKGGTGLGLSIANRIISAHNGSIRVSSLNADAGTGAVFTINLPV